MTKFNFKKQLFEVPTNTNVSKDFAPAISIDHVTRIHDDLYDLMRVLGVTDMTPLAEGSVIHRYKTVVTKQDGAVAEGDVIPLSKVVTSEILPALTVKLSKYRRSTTAESVQAAGKERSINKADNSLVEEIRGDIKKSFYKLITGGTPTAAEAGVDLQTACAQAWGALVTLYEGKSVTPIFFLNPLDVATYLGSANISTQSVFGLLYLENFLGLGHAILSADVTKGNVYATVTENLNGAYVPADGDVGEMFGLTADESGLIGMAHMLDASNATIDTLIMTGVVFYPELESGVVKSQITPSVS